MWLEKISTVFSNDLFLPVTHTYRIIALHEKKLHFWVDMNSSCKKMFPHCETNKLFTMMPNLCSKLLFSLSKYAVLNTDTLYDK